MTDTHSNRRKFLSTATGSMVTVGALIAGGALLRSCAPREPRISAFDFSDIPEGEVRLYEINNAPVILARTAGDLQAWDGYCPLSPGWVLQYDTFDDLYWCQHCTNRFNRAGQWTDRNGAPRAGRPDQNLRAVELPLTDDTLMVPENMAIPSLISVLS